MKFVYKDQAQRSLLVIFLLFFCLIAIKAHDLTAVKDQIKDSKEMLSYEELYKNKGKYELYNKCKQELVKIEIVKRLSTQTLSSKI